MNQPGEQLSHDEQRMREALRRSLSGERAPANLRDQISKALTDAIPPPAPVRIRGLSPMRFALAASMFIAIGVAAMLVARQRIASLLLPPQLASAIIYRHDGCSKNRVHQLAGIPRGDLELLRKTLSQRLGFPVLVTELDGSWNLVGGAICPVGSALSGHLVFRRGGQTLSIFSLNGAAVSSAAQGRHYQQMRDNHTIAGFIRDNTMYCVVANDPSHSFTLTDTKALRDRLEDMVESGKIALDTSAPPADLELLVMGR